MTPINYDKIKEFLMQNSSYLFSIKSQYMVISVPNTNYHITIYKDQWDDYENISGKPYHLFHISSNIEDNRCSTYFWVDSLNNRIKHIPSKYFKYNQSSFDFFSSRRNSCKLESIRYLLDFFQKFLWKIR